MSTYELFEKHNNEYLKFNRVEGRKSSRPDLHAFLLLDSLFPAPRDMVSAAAHDEIWLDVEDDQCATLSEDQIIELTRCGVRYDNENGGLAMFA